MDSRWRCNRKGGTNGREQKKNSLRGAATVVDRRMIKDQGLSTDTRWLSKWSLLRVDRDSWQGMSSDIRVQWLRYSDTEYTESYARTPLMHICRRVYFTRYCTVRTSVTPRLPHLHLPQPTTPHLPPSYKPPAPAASRSNKQQATRTANQPSSQCNLVVSVCVALVALVVLAALAPLARVLPHPFVSHSDQSQLPILPSLRNFGPIRQPRYNRSRLTCVFCSDLILVLQHLLQLSRFPQAFNNLHRPVLFV